MQRLVTIHLNSLAYIKRKWFNPPTGESHGIIEEHLQEELKSGWRIVSITALGGGGESFRGGWLAVLLESAAE